MKIFRGKIIWLILAILIVGGSWFLSQRMNRAPTGPQIASVPQPTPTDIEATTDSDQDSLMDWEETLWKTDSQNPDTDGDGTLDGEEVKSGRDPVSANTGKLGGEVSDKLDPEAIKEKVNLESEANLTETSKFSRELFVRIVSDKESGVEPTEADYQDFLAGIVEKTKNTGPLKIYRESDFKTASEDKVVIRAYGNAIAAIFITPPKEPLEHELAILSEVIENGNSKALEKLQPLVMAYKQIRATLLALPTPKSALPYQTAMTNATEGMIEMLEGLQLIYDDPLKAMAGLSSYQKTTGNFYDGLVALKEYFGLQKIVFAQNENGYKLFNNI